MLLKLLKVLPCPIQVLWTLHFRQYLVLYLLVDLIIVIVSPSISIGSNSYLSAHVLAPPTSNFPLQPHIRQVQHQISNHEQVADVVDFDEDGHEGRAELVIICVRR